MMTDVVWILWSWYHDRNY